MLGTFARKTHKLLAKKFVKFKSHFESGTKCMNQVNPQPWLSIVLRMCVYLICKCNHNSVAINMQLLHSFA